MSDHTPGPWTFGMSKPEYGDCIPIDRKGRWMSLAVVNLGPTKTTREEGEANARLIMAAPELLDAAFEALATLSIIAPGDQRKMKALSVLSAAIKKVEGP